MKQKRATPDLNELLSAAAEGRVPAGEWPFAVKPVAGGAPDGAAAGPAEAPWSHAECRMVLCMGQRLIHEVAKFDKFMGLNLALIFMKI